MIKQTKIVNNKINECLLVIDFGSQVTQLIARRLRELSVYSKIYPFQNINQKLLEELSPKAIIFSGGPSSVLDRNSPKVSKIIYNLVGGLKSSMGYLGSKKIITIPRKDVKIKIHLFLLIFSFNKKALATIPNGIAS